MGEPVLPSVLTDRPFTVRQARAAGLRYHELRAASLHAPTWAVRCLDEPVTLSARAAAAARGMPDDIAFSHVTAARLFVQALPLVRSGSRSAMGTRARLMFHRAGFPEPELTAAVRDAHGGWLLEGDFGGARRRACLRRLARALEVDPAELAIG